MLQKAALREEPHKEDVHDFKVSASAPLPSDQQPTSHLLSASPRQASRSGIIARAASMPPSVG